ncbi:phage tail assembly chaperone [Phocoenobacter skyensis]|uniref:phage tail assembly chaperone n=1 Tax=Phocoenobacter skyensis TaxID=97481 RepID=UPI003B75C671
MWEQTDIQPQELDIQQPSFAVFYLLDYFAELSASRQSGMTLNPILYSEIEVWARLKGICLSAWEVETIKQLDLIFLNVHQEN